MIKSTTLPINPRIVIITAGLFPTQHAQCLAKQMKKKKIIKKKVPFPKPRVSPIQRRKRRIEP